ncbi:MAG: hypothetical protein PHX78_07125 [bacterium]|nr:hypothetical protein [bacterium]
MSKVEALNDVVKVPRSEYIFLKELYKTVKRQQFLFRIHEAEQNLKAGKTKKMSVNEFIESL